MKRLLLTILFIILSTNIALAGSTIYNAPDGARTGAQMDADSTLALPLDDQTNDYYATLAALLDWIELQDMTFTGALDLSGATVTFGLTTSDLPTTGTWTLGAMVIDLSSAVVTFGLEASDIPDISATYEVQLNNEAGLYAVLSDVTQFYEAGDEDTIANAISADTITGSQVKYGDGLTLSGSDLVLDLGDDHTWTAIQQFPLFRGTLATGDLASDQELDIFLTDCSNYDPASTGCPNGDDSDDYFALHGDSDNFYALYNRQGDAFFNTITTTEQDYIPVAYMDDTAATNPAAAAYITGGSNSRKWYARAFDDASDENLTFNWQVPSDIVATSGIKFRWVAIVSNADPPTDTDDEDISFFLQGVSIGNNDSGDPAAFGTAVGSAFGATAAQYDIIYGAWSSAITVTDLAEGEMAHMNLYCDADVGDNSYDQDIDLIGIEIKYQRTHDTSF